mmetsp:Transcript_9760/g.22391  ORF Transcript_9760/g.22391 Transcript_9760/m.22391 type:complete len:212 (+) Transcript_9760:4312-4947(+)
MALNITSCQSSSVRHWNTVTKELTKESKLLLGGKPSSRFMLPPKRFIPRIANMIEKITIKITSIPTDCSVDPRMASCRTRPGATRSSLTMRVTRRRRKVRRTLTPATPSSSLPTNEATSSVTEIATRMASKMLKVSMMYPTRPSPSSFTIISARKSSVKTILIVSRVLAKSSDWPAWSSDSNSMLSIIRIATNTVKTSDLARTPHHPKRTS